MRINTSAFESGDGCSAFLIARPSPPATGATASSSGGTTTLTAQIGTAILMQQEEEVGNLSVFFYFIIIFIISILFLLFLSPFFAPIRLHTAAFCFSAKGKKHNDFPPPTLEKAIIARLYVYPHGVQLTRKIYARSGNALAKHANGYRYKTKPTI
jgi:hypothetical protein